MQEISLRSFTYLLPPLIELRHTFCGHLSKNGQEPSWIHFGTLRTHIIKKVFFLPVLLLKIQIFLILESFDHLPVVG